MIHYELRCSDGHGFEGWFRDSGAFEQQSERGLLTCPQCGLGSVERALMSPAVRSRSVIEKPSAAPVPSTERVIPDHLRALLQRVRAEVERRCDDVGDGFADAARRLHAATPVPGEPRRGIYGRVTEAERESLAEQGIETAQIPWLPRADG